MLVGMNAATVGGGARLLADGNWLEGGVILAWAGLARFCRGIAA
jgi:hypothetical protein